MTSDSEEVIRFGYNPPGGLEGVEVSGGGPVSKNELVLLNPVGKWVTRPDSTIIAHELGHIFLRQLCPELYWPDGKNQQNWLSWVSETLADFVSLECWLDNQEMTYPLRGFQDWSHLLVESCKTGNPPLIGLTRLENAWMSEENRSLAGAEGMAFICYLYERYGEEGFHSLISEYNSATFWDAAEKAFGLPFSGLEMQWGSSLARAAANLDRCDFELNRVRWQGVDVSRADKIRTHEPLLALLVAYASEERYRASGVLLPFLSPDTPLTIAFMKPDKPTRMGVESTAIISLEIRVSNEARGVGIALREVASPATPVPPGIVYRFIEITKENIADADISSVEVSFEVEKSWISANNLDPRMVALYRYNSGTWMALPTMKTGEDATYVFFQATSPGLSYFAIMGNVVVSSTPTTTTTPTPTPTPTPAPTPTPPAVPPALPVVLITVGLLVGILVWTRQRKRK
ncbi:MAG: PGF-pre-PGF domain-containing protein [Candidatus Hadarchaeaceae archaeon]